MGAALLQTRDNMSCHRDEVPDNSILRPIAFSSKSLTVTEKRYSNIERETLGIRYGLEKFHHYCFCQGGKYKHRPQTTCHHIQETCSQIVTKTPVNPIMNTSVQGQNHIQTWPRCLLGGLVVQKIHNENKDEEMKGKKISVNAI